MNLSILHHSFKYLNSLRSVVSLSFKLNNLLVQDRNVNDKFKRSIDKYDSEVSLFLYVHITNDTKLETVQSIYTDLRCINENNRQAKKIRFELMLQVFTLLIKDNIETYIDWHELLNLLCIYGYVDIVKIFIDAGYQIPPNGKLEQTAALFDNYELAKYLFEKGTRKNISLTHAADDYDMTKFLLDRNVRTEIDNALNVACNHNDTAIAKLLLEHGADPSESSIEEPLRCAIKYKNKELIKLLREHGASKTKAYTLNICTKATYYLFRHKKD